MILDDEKVLLDDAGISQDIQDQFVAAVGDTGMSGLVLYNTYVVWKAANSTKDFIDLVTQTTAAYEAATDGSRFYDIFVKLLAG